MLLEGSIGEGGIDGLGEIKLGEGLGTTVDGGGGRFRGGGGDLFLGGGGDLFLGGGGDLFLGRGGDLFLGGGGDLRRLLEGGGGFFRVTVVGGPAPSPEQSTSLDHSHRSVAALNAVPLGQLL